MSTNIKRRRNKEKSTANVTEQKSYFELKTIIVSGSNNDLPISI